MWRCLSLAAAYPDMAGPGDMKAIVDDITTPAEQCVKLPEHVIFQTGWNDRREVAPAVMCP